MGHNSVAACFSQFPLVPQYPLETWQIHFLHTLCSGWCWDPWVQVPSLLLGLLATSEKMILRGVPVVVDHMGLVF